MSDTRDAFGGHPETTKAIEEHRLWHDTERDGRSDVCWKEATYVRYLLGKNAALEEALHGIFQAWEGSVNENDPDVRILRGEIEKARTAFTASESQAGRSE